MPESSSQKDIEETTADLAYLAYQLRKLAEKASTAIELSTEKMERLQRRRDRWWASLVMIFLISILLDVFLRVF